MSNVSHHQELNDMRTLLPLLLALSTSGCAVTSTEVNVALARVGTRSAIRVEDVRLNKQLYMSAIALGGQASTYPLTPSPPLDIALMERLAAGQSLKTSDVGTSVAIQSIDLKNRVGFGTADDLTCAIESSVTRKAGAREAGLRVRSFSRSQTNMSPFIRTAAEVILRQCLEQHAKDILQFVVVSGDG